MKKKMIFVIFCDFFQLLEVEKKKKKYIYIYIYIIIIMKKKIGAEILEWATPHLYYKKKKICVAIQFFLYCRRRLGGWAGCIAIHLLYCG